MSNPAQRYAAWIESGGLQFLRRVDFELSSVCNLKCAFCSLQRRKDYPSFMPVELFERVLSQLIETPVQALGLYFSGESLLHPKFEAILEVARQAIERHPAFHPLVYMHTNGVLWTPARTDAILRKGVLQRIVWSLDGVNEETFLRIRPGAPYHRLLDQFEYLLGRRSGPVEIWVNNMLDESCRGAVPDARLAALFKKADRVRSYYPYDLNEGPSFGYYKTGTPDSFCCYSLDTVVVTAKGQLSLCCVDLNARNAFGNLHEESFAGIYNGPVHRHYLEWMSQGERSRVPGCARCTVGDGVDSFAFGEPVFELPLPFNNQTPRIL